MRAAAVSAIIAAILTVASCQGSPFGGPDPIGKPNIDLDRWRLEVLFHSRRLCEFSYDDLTGLPHIEVPTCLVRRDNTGACGTFGGVPLEVILERCAQDIKADRVVFVAANGYESSMSIAEIKNDWIVALTVNGRRLTRDEGFPARMVIPQRYDYKWVRWLKSIVLIRGDHFGFWEFIGEDQSGRVPRHIFKRLEREWKAHRKP